MKVLKNFAVSLFIAMCAIVAASCATSTTGEKITEPVEYSDVVEVPNVMKDELYKQVNMWCVDAFKSSDSVIQYNDKEEGVIKGKYIDADLLLDNPGNGDEYVNIRSTITLEVKDSKYRVSFSDPYVRATGNSFGGPNTYKQVQKEQPVTVAHVAALVQSRWQALAESLKKAVASPAKKSDW